MARAYAADRAPGKVGRRSGDAWPEARRRLGRVGRDRVGTGIRPGSQEARKPESRNWIPASRFVLKNIVAWFLMVIVLVLVPDSLEERMGLGIARVIGWAVAFPIWLLIVERGWQSRFGPVARVAL